MTTTIRPSQSMEHHRHGSYWRRRGQHRYRVSGLQAQSVRYELPLSGAKPPSEFPCHQDGSNGLADAVVLGFVDATIGRQLPHLHDRQRKLVNDTQGTKTHLADGPGVWFSSSTATRTRQLKGVAMPCSIYTVEKVSDCRKHP